jgi:hypothetical protein
MLTGPGSGGPRRRQRCWRRSVKQAARIGGGPRPALRKGAAMASATVKPSGGAGRYRPAGVGRIVLVSALLAIGGCLGPGYAAAGGPG